jgi:hypothetical protein
MTFAGDLSPEEGAYPGSPVSGTRDLDAMTSGIPRSRNGRMVRQINARAESVSPRIARCAVVSDGFYDGPAVEAPFW